MKIQIVLNPHETVTIEVEKLVFLEVADAVYAQTQSYTLAGIAWTKVHNGDYVVLEAE